MSRLIGQAVLLALAFYAGVRFEATGAGDFCQGSPDWGTYLQCVMGHLL